jgi:hypothetical protein
VIQYDIDANRLFAGLIELVTLDAPARERLIELKKEAAKAEAARAELRRLDAAVQEKTAAAERKELEAAELVHNGNLLAQRNQKQADVNAVQAAKLEQERRAIVQQQSDLEQAFRDVERQKAGVDAARARLEVDRQAHAKTVAEPCRKG